MKRVVIMIAVMVVSGAVMAQQSSDQTSAGVNDIDLTGDGNNANQNINQQQSSQQQDNDNAAININDIAIETRPTENSNIGSSSSSSSSSSKSSSNNSLSNAGNASVTVEGDDFPASSAIAPSINPTSPCMGSSSAGGQGMSFGVSVGSSWRDKECEKREAFRMGMESGHPEVTALALEVYRNLEAVREALNPGQPGEQARARPSSGSAYNNALAGARKSLP